MKVILLGAANPETGRMIRALERVQPNYQVLGFIDNDPEKKGKTFVGLPVFGGFEELDDLLRDDVYFVNLITGSTKTRYETSRYMAQKGCKFCNFIHPTVDLTMTEVGTGNYIQEGVNIQAAARIGNNSSISVGAVISHESIVGDSVFAAPAVSVSGCVEIGDGTFIGTNATILPRLKIGKWVTIGAGAVVVKDVPDYTVVVGNPARPTRMIAPAYSHGDIFRETSL